MSQRKGTSYTYMFAGVVCLVCALILSVAATALKPYQDQNVLNDIIVNLMASVGEDPKELAKLTKQEVVEKFNREFKTEVLNADNELVDRKVMEEELLTLNYPAEELASLDTGLLLRRYTGKAGLLSRRLDKPKEHFNLKIVYKHLKDGEVDAYVIPIEGYGLWDLMKGYIALEPDLNTVKGLSFYEHKETPGLGARVDEAWFKDQYVGKQILDDSGDLVSITVTKGPAPEGDPHKVDGISGATLTGDGINIFLMRDLARYEPYFQTVRN